MGPVGAVVAEQLKALRAAASLTRDEVAAAAQEAGAPTTLTAAALRNIETGRRSADVDELVWLAAALRTVPAALLADQAEQMSPARPAVECGEVETATRRALEGIEDDLTGMDSVLAQSALVLARILDQGTSTSPTSVARELRATLAQLWKGQDAGGDEDEDDDLGAA